MIAGCLVTIVLLVVLGLRTERGATRRDRLMLAVPVVGSTIQFALVERFCRVLSSMLGAGVGLPESLRVATGSLRNRVYMRSMTDVNEAILQGQGIVEPLSRTSMFPAAALQMLRVGEETGTLDNQLAITAEYYETELDYKIRKLTALFEPIVILVMGLVVGFVAIALVSAMYGVFRQVEV